MQEIFKNFNKANLWNVQIKVGSLYHLVPSSGYPFILSIALFLTIISSMSLSDYNMSNFSTLFNRIAITIALVSFLISVLIWLVQVLREAASGEHTNFVINGLKLGFLLFISSEIMLFFAVFWGWFHLNLLNEFVFTETHSPNYLEKVDWYPLPALATLILGSSSAFLTEAHYTFNWPIFYFKVKNLLNLFKQKFVCSSYRLLRMTCGFGILFLTLQSIEYNMMGYSWKGNVYASLFYMITSLHGSHVFIGLLFLLGCYFRLWAHIIQFNFFQNATYLQTVDKFSHTFIWQIDYLLYLVKCYLNKVFHYIQLSEQRHLFFEVSAWYWHFVDIVWLFVFLYVYFWLKGYQTLF